MENAFYSLPRLLYERKGSEARIDFGEFLALLEKECEEGTALGKLRRVDRPEDDSGLLPGQYST